MTRGLILDAMRLQLSDDWRIAHASSARDGRPRWTEISVFVLPDEEAARLGTKRRFVAEVLARSTFQGERTKTRRVATGTLDRALDWIDDSDLGAAVKVQAREYAIEEGIEAAAIQRKEDERLINEVLYPVDSPGGRAMAIDLIDEMGLDALTDAAVRRLAQRQHDHEMTRNG